MSGIALTAGVRQNLLSLQSTADMMSMTQNRLATGKKVNSALDNPSNFFTSSSLGDRASDLSSLLDSIGQATKTLDAANNGITSLTKLVQSAKSTAQQARQATGQTTTYASVNANADIANVSNLGGGEDIKSITGSTGVTGEMSAVAIAKSFAGTAETLGTLAGVTAMNAATIAGNTDLTIDVTVGATTTSVVIAGGDLTGLDHTQTAALIQSEIDSSAVGAGMVTVASTAGGNGTLSMDAANADVDFTVRGGAMADEIGLAGAASPANDNTALSTSLLDNIIAAGGASGATLTLDVNGGTANGGTTKTITFSNAAISTFAELNTELTNNGIGSGASGSVSGGNTLNLNHTAAKTNTLAVAASSTGLRDALGMNTARAIGQTGGIGTGTTGLSRTFNSAATLADTNPATLVNGSNLSITVNGSTQTVGLLGTDRLDDIINKLSSNSTLGNNLSFEDDQGNLKITAKTADVDFTVAAGSATGTVGSLGLGLDTAAQDSVSLLDRLNTALGGTSGQGSTLTVAVNGGAAQTVTFGTGTDQVSTLAEFSTKLGTLSGVTASINGTALNFQVASGTSATSLDIGGTAASALGVSGLRSGAVTATTANTTRASLQTDFNNVLTQIDSLAKDASYNGNNLLNGDDLKVTFNENGSSSLTISGVTFDSNNLGLNAQAGDAFQDNTAIDAVIANADKALNSLRTQASKFGSTLTTVQTRQEFTKNMINTLQTGADALVLADTNEEGANLLALQTRQQLSTTALSMANQASQAVLRLF